MVTIVSVFWFVWRPKKQLCTGDVCAEAEERLSFKRKIHCNATRWQHSDR